LHLLSDHDNFLMLCIVVGIVLFLGFSIAVIHLVDSWRSCRDSWRSYKAKKGYLESFHKTPMLKIEMTKPTVPELEFKSEEPEPKPEPKLAFETEEPEQKQKRVAYNLKKKLPMSTTMEIIYFAV
jgi:hypothetical protein